MATVIFIKEGRQNRSAMRAVINYCQQQYKTFDSRSKRRLVSGVNCDGANAFREFMATDKRCCIRKDERHNGGNEDREDDLLGLRNRTKLPHFDCTLFLGCQCAHNRRLNNRHKCHVAVGSNGNRT